MKQYEEHQKQNQILMSEKENEMGELKAQHEKVIQTIQGEREQELQERADQIRRLSDEYNKKEKILKEEHLKQYEEHQKTESDFDV